ncbi:MULTISPECIES: MarR family winged helix-turn-helix transcriptional regulator [unclassified Hahella]|uniref:MarR family winged helix-turn-helix transcriptional regulator n=1 Tax=unclassified Hahella TaxID=2624107 RepID=UPI001C1EC72D|nr:MULTISPECIES: MarR family transcriptional regulator [unclassified Hahella]MBU6950973.1 MarR family transcriptional regulator [Hahella sp. HN01]MDG9666703.1 MarR family transcriptional regulator [Hahella sp. CR1]
MKLDDSLGFLLNKAAGEMKFALETALRPYDLTPGQWSVLARLRQNDGQKISELGKSLFFDRPTMSGIIRRLDAKGLILKVPDASDQRAYRIHISAKGVELMGELPILAQDINARALNAFTPEEASQFKDYLRRVLKNMS